MNITHKMMFEREVQPNVPHLNNMKFNEFLLLLTICYLFTRMMHYLGSSYVNL